jgi:DNA-directed RNA polymerase subunit beta
VLLKEMQSLALDVNVVSEEGTRAEMGDEDDDLLRAAEELGIDLSGVRAGGGSAGSDGAADEAEEQEVVEGEAGTTGDTTDEYIADPVEPEALAGNEEILAEAGEPAAAEDE